MLKGRELRGLRVLAGQKKEEVGRVSDIFIDDASGRIQGFAIAAAGIVQRFYYVDIRGIREISKMGLVVPNKKSIKRIPKDMAGMMQKGWIGSRLLDYEGRDRGTVADVLVKNGQVAGLEISAGIFNDLESRRDFLPWQSVSPEQGVFRTGEDLYF